MKKLLFLLLLSGSSFSIFAQEDAEGCKDHKFFNRLPNFFIETCAENFNSFDFLVGRDKHETIEGNMYKARYVFNREKGKAPSQLQVVRNYETAIVKNGGQKVYLHKYGDGYQVEGETYKLTKDGTEYYMEITNFYSAQVAEELDAFDIIIVEREPMKQDIEASAMFDELNKSGHVALYINFETGKSTIKPESASIVDQMVEMLKTNPGLKVSIEGHTDNTGTAATNKILSENRAKALMATLVSRGIDAPRLSAKGWGQDKPIADNGTEDGRAKNRRVEIVKK